MNWKTPLQSASVSVNDDLRLRIEYLTTENWILRQQVSGRLQLSDRDRKELGEIGRQLGRKDLAEIATVAHPDTIVAWGRKFANQPVATAKPPKSVGRPRVDQEIEDLVIRMARENRSWGYDRIQGCLKHLGYTISDQTVGNILKRQGIPPSPERQKAMTWRDFIRSHWEVLVASGFFNREVWSWLGPMIACLLSVIHFSRHPVQSLRMTLNQPRLGMRSFIRSLLDLSAHVHCWVRIVRLDVQQGSIRCDEISVETTIFEYIPSDESSPRAPDGGQVVMLRAISPKPIRDGPIQGQRWTGTQLTDRDCEAA